MGSGRDDPMPVLAILSTVSQIAQLTLEVSAIPPSMCRHPYQPGQSQRKEGLCKDSSIRVDCCQGEDWEAGEMQTFEEMKVPAKRLTCAQAESTVLFEVVEVASLPGGK